MEKFLDSLLVSLCSIEVKGEDNLNILLGCILAVKDAREQLNAQPQEEPKEEGE